MVILNGNLLMFCQRLDFVHVVDKCSGITKVGVAHAVSHDVTFLPEKLMNAFPGDRLYSPL